MALRLKLRIAALLSLPLIHPGIYGQLANSFTAAAAVPVAAVASDRITASVTGHGPNVILIPGLASSAHVWDATVAHLAAGHRVHVIQVSGFAGSAPGANANGPVLEPTVAALHDYIVANKLQGAAVIGHSLGGLMAMKLGIEHPGDAGRIMIVDMVTAPVRLKELPQLAVSKVRTMIGARKDRRFQRALQKLVSDPRWKTMLKYNPIRAEHEMKWYLESRFPGKQVERLDIGVHNRVLAFDSGPLQPGTVPPQSYP